MKHTLRTFVVTCAISAAWFAASAAASFALSPRGVSFATLWLPSGVYLALLIRRRRQEWPAIIVGASIAQLYAELALAHRTPASATAFVLVSLLEAVSGAWLLTALGGVSGLGRLSEVGRLVSVALGVAAIPGALVGTALVEPGGQASFAVSWATWWIADLLGILVATPAFLIRRDEWWSFLRLLRGWRLVEAALAFATLALTVGAVAWLPPHPARGAFLVLPWFLWITFRFGAPALVVGAFGTSILTVIGTIAGGGPFASFPRADALLFVQFVVTVGIVCMHLLAATMREREESLVQLRHHEQDTLVRRFADTAPAILWAADLDGRRTFLSRGWMELTGQAASGGLGSGWLQTVHPEDRDVVSTTSTRAMELREPYQVRYRVRSASGAYRWVLSAGRPQVDGHGFVFGYVGSLIDIHDQTEAAAALARANALLDAVFQSAPVGLAFLDRDLRFQRLNEEAAAMNGLTVAAHVGRTPQDLLPGIDNIADIMIGLGEVIATGQPLLGVNVVGETLASPGERRQWRSNFFPVSVAGEVLGVGVVINDVTEQKRAEQELRDAARNKDEFLAMLAHELRNPLATIHNAVGVLEVAASGSGPHVTAREIVSRQLSHMVRLVNDLLDVSRLSRGKLSLQRAPADLVAVVRESAADVQRLFDEAGIAFAVTLPPDPVWTDGDRTRLAQLIGNLLHNALKFTSPGGRVHLRLSSDFSRGVATILVEDTGIGMNPELLSKAFDEFSQGAQSLARTPGGLGLGLALVKRFAELHGGRVEARSEGLHRGSTFVVELPARTQETELVIPSVTVQARTDPVHPHA